MEAPLFHDPNFPELRSSEKSRPGLSFSGETESGTIIPGVIDLADVLDSSVYSGLPHPSKDEMRVKPANAPDIIVTVLYQHSPRTLRRFLDCKEDMEFTYVHKWNEKATPEAQPKDSRSFIVTRVGQMVEAGYRACPVDGETSQDWDECVRYVLLPHGEWRRDSWIHNRQGLSQPFTLSMGKDESAKTRWDFGYDVVDSLSLTIIQRRWWAATRQFQIEVTVSPRKPQGDKESVEFQGEKNMNDGGTALNEDKKETLVESNTVSHVLDEGNKTESVGGG